jgi:hypothetical protein
MKRTLIWLTAGGAAVWLVSRKVNLAKALLVKEAAVAVWNDPAVKKTRKRTVKKVQKAAKKYN